MDILLAFVGSVLLWCAGTAVFDAVHWVLHGMLESRWRLLRALAWPHAVHHQWLDRSLRTRWEHQTRNIWCHLVPEYLTQAAFTLATWLVLPTGIVAGCLALQTIVFLALLSYKGLDINHRAVEILDAYQPSWFASPAYHALHHVYPHAYFSAYSKLVDWVVGGGTALRGRRFIVRGVETPFGRALRDGLVRAGVGAIAAVDGDVDAALRAADVLVLCDPAAPEAPLVEAFIAATGTRQLPPEVWSVHSRPDHPLARHYYGDVRVLYRTIVLPPGAAADARRARRAARIAMFFVRRGAHYVIAALAPATVLGARRFRRGGVELPPGAPRIRTRAELLARSRPIP